MARQQWLQKDLDPLVHLVTAPIAAGQDARKTNAKLTAAAEQKGEQKVLEQLTQSAPAAIPPLPAVAPQPAAVMITPSTAAARTKKRG